MEVIDVFMKLPPAFPDAGFPLVVQEILQNIRLSMHTHLGFLEIVLVVSGRALHVLPEETYEITAGDVLVLLPGSWHTYQETADFRYVNILARWNKLGIQLRDAMERPSFQALFGGGTGCRIRLASSSFEEFRNAVARLRLTLQRRAPGYRFEAMAQYMRLLLKLCAAYEEREPREMEMPPERIARLGEYLEAHYAEPIRIGELCRLAMMSRSALFTQFRRYYDAAPLERLATIRLRHACRLLDTTSIPVSEIARRCGFNTPSFFIAVFRRHHGMTPAAFRKRGQET